MVRRVATGLAVSILLVYAIAWTLALIPHTDGLSERDSLVISPLTEEMTSVADWSGSGILWRYWRDNDAQDSYGVHLLRNNLVLAESSRVFVDPPSDHGWGTLETHLTQNPPAVGSSIDFGSGWPCIACWCELRITDLETTNWIAVHVEAIGGIPIMSDGDSNESPRALPYRPAWRGLAIDTVLYLLVGWMLLAIPRFVMRRRRRKTNRCIACGYDLTGVLTSVCPECGFGRTDDAENRL